jgi:hypothetical protein
LHDISFKSSLCKICGALLVSVLARQVTGVVLGA